MAFNVHHFQNAIQTAPSQETFLLSAPAQGFLNALRQKQAFKLIVGGSYTEATSAGQLAALYAQAGASCIDMAPDANVLGSIQAALAPLAASVQPALMVSLPLDPDPHFQKIELATADCITCGACVPVCPSQALAVPDKPLATHQPLLIDQPLCYGCGRCLPICPTEALSLLPNHPNPKPTLAVLNNPAVDAVEIHSRYADPALIPDFIATYGEGLKSKIIALCFQPAAVEPGLWVPFVAQWQQWCHTHSPAPLIIQIDGRPMSGTHTGGDATTAPIPAIHAAWKLYQTLQTELPDFDGFITLSGGMNQHAGPLLAAHPVGDVVSGIGVGTVARQWVWPDIKPGKKSHPEHTGVERAKVLVNSFLHRDAQGK